MKTTGISGAVPRRALVPGRRRAMPAMVIVVLVMLAAVVPGIGVSPQAAATSAAGFQYNCHGRIGVLKTGTRVALADWDRDGTPDECFGIAPDRRIYHAWRTSNGWDPMPHNGLADNMEDPGWNAVDYGGGQQRSVYVVVYDKGTYVSCRDTGYPDWAQWSPWGVLPYVGCQW